jgi:hypothetical protein
MGTTHASSAVLPADVDGPQQSWTRPDDRMTVTDPPGVSVRAVGLTYITVMQRFPRRSSSLPSVRDSLL